MAKDTSTNRILIELQNKNDNVIGIGNGTLLRGPKGCHFEQLLVDGIVAWEQDVADGTFPWSKVRVDVTRHVRGKTSVTIAFRVIDKKGCATFPVHWRLSDLKMIGLQVAAKLNQPE